MNVRPLVVLALAGLAASAPGVARAVDEVAAKERAGVRAGGVLTFDQLNEAYGGGWGLTLYFNERLTRPLFLDFRLGALYLGDLQLEQLDDALTNTPNVQGAMRLLYLTGGVVLGRPLGNGYALYGSAGAGVYSVSVVFDTGVSAFDFSDQNLGFNGGLGLTRRISGNWCLEGNATVHYFLVDSNLDDLYYAFTDGDDSPLIVDIAVGVIVDLR
jgi:hypothetical protein